jgi:hypothetical protein
MFASQPVLLDGGPPVGMNAAEVNTIIRMADEGVPVSVIARTMKKDRSDVELVLHEAKDAGKIIALPRADWSPTSSRDNRAVEISQQSSADEILLSIMRAFNLSGGEAAVFTALYRRDHGTKLQLHNASKRNNPDKDTEPKIVDVYICKIRRKLAKQGHKDIVIETMWGKGYHLNKIAKQKIAEILSRS